jgi:hypothetical protein
MATVATPSRNSAAIDGREDHRADRAGDECQRKDRKGIESAGQRIEIGEDELRKHQHRSDRIDEEVKELGGPADDDANGDLARVNRSVAIRVQKACVPFDRR